MTDTPTDIPVCRSCAFTNLPQALFCGGCGRWLNPIDCPHCGTANPRLHRACHQCGEPLYLPDTATSGYCGPANPSLTLRDDAAARSPAIGKLNRLLASLFAASPFAGAIAKLAENCFAVLAIGAAVVILAQLGLVFSLEVNVKASAGYLLLLALGAGLIILGSIGLSERQLLADRFFSSPHEPATKVNPFPVSFVGIFGLMTGILAFGSLLIPLAAGSNSGYLLIPWLMGLVAFAALFLPRLDSLGLRLNGRAGRVIEELKRHYLDALIVLGLMALFLGIVASDLRNWYYSAIGDEFLFYEHAKRIVEEGIARPFSQAGVYNKYPVMSSVFQALSMRLFGADYFGWTFSEALNAAITIPGIYLLGYILGGRKAAVLSAALFAVSHYILALSHAGYSNLSPLPVAVWSIAFFAWGWRSDNPLHFYLAGVVAGLGFYTHYSGRAILPVIILFALTAGSPRRFLDMWPLAFGFALAVVPTFLVEREQVLTRMFSEVVGGYSEVVTGSPLDRILGNIELNLPAFNYSSTVHTYVYGALLDPVTAVLAVLGIAFALGHFKLQHFRLLLVWFGVAMVVTGVLPHVAVTRLTFAIPPLVLLAGVSASQIADAVLAHLNRLKLPSSAGISASLLALVLSGALLLNLWQLWIVTPTVHPHTPEAVALGAFQSAPCDGNLAETVFVGRAVGEGSLMNQVLDSFHPNGPSFRLLNHDEFQPDTTLADRPVRCVVFLEPGSPEIRPLQERLARRYPDGRMQPFTNPSGTTTVYVFVPRQ